LWGGWQNFTATPFANHAPVVTAANVSAARGQTSASAASLFSVTDADGDTITKYALWDTQGNGHWVVNGVQQATNAEVDITAAKLAQTTYVFGSATDSLSVQAFDGTTWSGWKNSTATPFANHMPVVTPASSNVSATHNQSFNAASLFNVSDADGDTMTQYALWNGGGSGHWVVNGVTQTAGVEIDISAAQLAQTTYRSGSGADTLYVKANDGTVWGNWSSAFTVTGPADRTPVITAANMTAAHGQTSIAAASLFSVSDADGDTITQYALWDVQGSGHWVVNNVVQPTNTEIDISAAQLA